MPAGKPKQAQPVRSAASPPPSPVTPRASANSQAASLSPKAASRRGSGTAASWPTVSVPSCAMTCTLGRAGPATRHCSARLGLQCCDPRAALVASSGDSVQRAQSMQGSGQAGRASRLRALRHPSSWDVSPEHQHQCRTCAAAPPPCSPARQTCRPGPSIWGWAAGPAARAPPPLAAPSAGPACAACVGGGHRQKAGVVEGPPGQSCGGGSFRA